MNSQQRRKLFTFSSGGWVVLLAGGLGLLLIAWAIAPAILRWNQRPPGDGQHIESFGFDLTQLQVPRELVVPVLLHRDMVPVMTDPTSTGPDDATDSAARWHTMQKRSDPKYGKYLVPKDVIIGVEINGQARAYPLITMYVHEIVNDTLGGMPIAVTYNVLCDSTVVFDRRISSGRNDSTRIAEFAVSGLAYNSNMLMYDRNETRTADSPQWGGGNESLYSQLLGKAVSGTASSRGAALKPIPHQLMRWADWIALHPNTTVLDRDLRFAARYKDASPRPYFQSPKLAAPVRPMPPEDGPPLKTPVIAVIVGEQCRVYPLPDLIESAYDNDSTDPRTFTDTFASHTIEFTCDRESQTARVEFHPPGPHARIVHALWFAWHAMHPNDELWRSSAPAE